MTEWLAVISITLFAVISPGPDFAMVSRNSLLLSRSGGVLTALGIGAGVLVHVAYTLLGAGLLIRQSPQLFDMLKLCGAAYLIWLGVKMLRARAGTGAEAARAVAVSDIQAFRMGFLTNVLNPKTTIFVVSLFMQVVRPATPPVTQVAYGLFISLAHVTWFSLVSLVFTAPRIRHTFLSLGHWIDRAFGVLLVSFGIGLALADIGN